MAFSKKSYKRRGMISNGLADPDGNFLDMSGNLDLADWELQDIVEYAPGGKTPSFVYNEGMIDPVDVTVDSHGNVYEADFNGDYAAVREYAQGSNAVLHSCFFGNGVEGVAVTKAVMYLFRGFPGCTMERSSSIRVDLMDVRILT